MTERFRLKAAVFVLIEKGNQVLLARRFNTGWEDGKYNLPSGHVEADETPLNSAVREAKEEVGVDIRLEDLELVHTNFFDSYINLCFKATKWNDEPKIMEADKCDDLLWVDYDKLPSNLSGSTLEVLQSVRNNRIYSESTK